MAKTDVKKVTGIGSYALFSDAAVKAMNIDAALTPFSQSFDHFGEVPMQVYDLAKAWEKFRQSQERHFLEESDGVYTFRRHLEFPPAVVWEGLVAPELKKRWMDMISVDVDRPEGRIGAGSGYHCAHKDADFRYWVTDWEPFDYFSTIMTDPGNDGLKFHETYHLMPTETGTEAGTALGAISDSGASTGSRHFPSFSHLTTSACMRTGRVGGSGARRYAACCAWGASYLSTLRA